MRPIEPIRRVPVAEAVLSDLRERIEDGIYPVGSKLPAESKLAEQYGVSRPVIREALLGCGTLGLTETHTGRGTFVISRSIESGFRLARYSVDELSQARPHIEMPSAALAATHRTEEELDELRNLLNEMHEITTGSIEINAPRLVELDASFHVAIARASRNGIFESIVLDMRDAMAQQSGLLANLAARAQSSHAEHHRVFEAIEAGDAEAALHAMSIHLGAVDEAIIQISQATFGRTAIESDVR